MRPRVLVNVKHIDMSCTMMGSRSTLPLYVSATALGKLAHPDGEVAITRACHTAGSSPYCFAILPDVSLMCLSIT
jgi:isopentenyl diphosphate isomerase/L-lactate dehydrogenase-like FMN-dependent dehydrogenase